MRDHKIVFPCKKCGKLLRRPEKSTGRLVSCARCGTVNRTPGLAGQTKASAEQVQSMALTARRSTRWFLIAFVALLVANGAVMVVLIAQSDAEGWFSEPAFGSDRPQTTGLEAPEAKGAVSRGMLLMVLLSVPALALAGVWVATFAETCRYLGCSAGLRLVILVLALGSAGLLARGTIQTEVGWSYLWRSPAALACWPGAWLLLGLHMPARLRARVRVLVEAGLRDPEG